MPLLYDTLQPWMLAAFCISTFLLNFHVNWAVGQQNLFTNRSILFANRVDDGTKWDWKIEQINR